MRRSPWQSLRFPSLIMLFSLLGLLAVGVIFVHSATAPVDGRFPSAAARLHMLRLGAGLVALLCLLRIDYRQLERLSTPLYVLGILSLLGLLVQRLIQGGVVRWIHLPGFNVQPAEIMKLVVILVIARQLKPRGSDSDIPVLGPLSTIALPMALIAMQPDLGSALVFPPILVAMLWIRGYPGHRLMAAFFLIVLIVPFTVPFLRDYQKNRVLAFLPQSVRELEIVQRLEPEAASSRARSYQSEHSIIAIGSGGPLGKGLGLGSMNYLDLVPENHNDFIFGVIGEEWGLRGTLGVTGLFLALLLGCARVAYRSREPFGRLVAVGITAQLGFQTIVNIAMTVGLAPVTGLPLPFVSYGGSSILCSLASVGIVLGIGMRPVRILNPDGLRAGASPVRRRAYLPSRGLAHRA